MVHKRVTRIRDPIVAIVAMPYWWDGFLNDHRENFSAIVFDYQDPISTYARSEKIHRHMTEVFTELVSNVSGIITHTDANYQKLLGYRKSSDISIIRNGEMQGPVGDILISKR